ncbi:MAG: serine/threonine protein kinase, partial [Pseudomonadota bacterium]|nr:serine/threonine protein kinase [Pseudomonadota bacterium]
MPVPNHGPGNPVSGADDDRTVIRPARSAGAAPAVADDDGGNTLPPGTRIGEFEIIRVLGEGGFGIVYLAQDHSLERQIALKEYMPSALAARLGGTQVQVRSERHRETFEAGRKSFVNEARLLAQFDHPSLVKVFRFWEANGTAYMVMPYYQGITLKQKLLDLGQPPDEEWLMGVLAPLTEALQVIHGENCFHRDIAPDNVILLAGSERPLLLDFGAARRVIGDMTQALTVILKPGYAPVEQYAESPDMKQGAWTDVYALAASVYFAILGKTPPAAVGRLIQDQYVPLVECCAGRYSEGFLRALDRALKVRPEDRTQSIAELREDLGLSGYTVSRGETVMAPARATAAGRTTTPVTRGGAPARAVGGGRGKWLAAAVAALALAGGAAWLLMPHGKPETPPARAAAGAAAPGSS